MSRFILGRILRSAITLWLVVTLVFFGLRLSGDPFELMLGENAQPEAIQQMREAYGLDRSPLRQYTSYLGTLAKGDFGQSLTEPRPVTQIVMDRLPATIELTAISLILALVIGVPIGIAAAVRRNTLFDRAIITFCFLGQSMPGFLIAILLIFAFAVWLSVLPSSGRGGLDHLVLPVIAMTWGGLATIARMTRSSILETLNQDFVRTARAKGLRDKRVLISHVMRNAAVPLVTLLGFLISATVAGSIIIETVFAWPGMGRLISTAVTRRDYPVLQFAVILITGTVILVNFLVDIAYGLVDPRIRVQGKA